MAVWTHGAAAYRRGRERESSLIVVTGAAGFIGSNLVRALNARGRTRPAAGRRPHRTGTSSRNLVDCDFADYVDKDGVPGARGVGDAARADRGDPPPGRLLRHHRVERPGHARRQLRDVEDPVHVRRGARHPVHLRLVRRGLRPGPGVPRGPRLRAAAQPVRLVEAALRPLGAAAPARRCAARSWACATSTCTARARATRATWRASPGSTTCSSRDGDVVRLFEGTDGFADGEQRRDFVYVGDVVAVNLWFLDHPRRLGHLQRRHAAARRASTTSRAR